MEHTNRFEDDSMDPNEYEDDYEDEGPEEFREEVPEITPRDRFMTLVQQILSLHAGAGDTYQRLHDTVAPFDRELAAKLKACQQADEALIAYCQKKVEQNRG